MTSVTVVAVVVACLWPTDEVGDHALAAISIDPQAAQQDTALPPSGDNFTWQNHPNQNNGTATELRTGVGGAGRAFLRWDQAAIQAAIGSNTLLMARVELTIQSSSGWSGGGGKLGIHRVTQEWTELASTANCAIDADSGNDQPDCSGATAWNLSNPALVPWVSPPIDSMVVTNGQTGTVAFDVTGDIAAFVGGAANYGWIVKPRNDASAADMRLRSRENVSRPMLVLTVTADTGRPPLPTSLGLPPDSVALLVPHPDFPSETIYYRNIVGVVFDDTTSGVTILRILNRHGGAIIGGGVETYIVQVTDPGSTLQALDSVIAAVGSEVGVRYATRVDRRDRRSSRGRYPNDGSGSSRQDWFSSSPGSEVRSRLMIRAPLAWGCETGTYDTSRVGIGVLDYMFDESHFDLPGFRLWETAQDVVDSLNLVDRNHGFGVAGIAAAVGDNEQGIAGLVWDSDLVLLALGRGSNLPAFISDRWVELLREAADSNVRVVVSAVGLGLASYEPLVQTYKDALTAYLQRSANNLFVWALPDENGLLERSIEEVANTTDGTVFALDRAVAQVYATFPSQIVLVAGTDELGAFFDGDFWTASSLIVAPAASITTLARLADFPSGVRVVNGTSYSAPFVAGVAAQLLGQDPLLTAAQVKDYIIRGAKEPRLNPVTGQLELADSVLGAPEPTYQLDAYGALTLLSRERPNSAPICGSQVWTANDTIYASRDSLAPRAIRIQGASQLAFPSVARGGRLIAVTDFAAMPTESVDVLIVNPAGTVVQTVPDRYARQYLERGTADLRFEVAETGGTRLRLDLEGTGNSALDAVDDQDLSERVAPGAVRSLDRVVVSPLGDWAAIQTLVQDAATEDRWDLVPLPTGSVQPVVTIVPGEECGPGGNGTDCAALIASGAGWAHDSRRVVVTIPYGDLTAGDLSAIRSRISSIPFVNGSPQVGSLSDPVQGVWLLNPRLTSDDVLFATEDADLLAETCVETRRLAVSPFTERGSRAVVNQAVCDPFDTDTPGIFNSRSGLRRFTRQMSEPRLHAALRGRRRN